MELAGALPLFVLWLHRYFGALEDLLQQRGILLQDPSRGEIL